MTKEELINKINDLVTYLTNTKVTLNNYTYNGHPNFYLLHTKEEFEKELESVIQQKEEYDRYDFYYYVSYMIKYMLNQYDSHTIMSFEDHNYLPIVFQIKENIPYIIGIPEELSYLKGSKILKINGVDINLILKDLEKNYMLWIR